MNKKMPVLFLSHGSPMNVILENEYTRQLIKLGQELEEPKAILIISSHWKTKGTYLTYSESPRQIYDFYGFPDQIYNIKYEPNGGKEYAEKIYNEIKSEGVELTLINYKALGDISKLDVPTYEHLLPLLYAIGAQEKEDNVEVIHKSIQNSSVSMTCIKIG